MFGELHGRRVSEQRRENLKRGNSWFNKTFPKVKVTKSVKLLQRSGYKIGITEEAWIGYRYLKGLTSLEADPNDRAV